MIVVCIWTGDELLLEAGSNCIGTNEKVYHDIKVTRNYIYYNKTWYHTYIALRGTKRAQNSKSNDASAHAHKIQLKYILYVYSIKFDCLNIDELLSVCFHMDKQNAFGYTKFQCFGHGNSLMTIIKSTRAFTKPRTSAIFVIAQKLCNCSGISMRSKTFRIIENNAVSIVLAHAFIWLNCIHWSEL